MALLNINDKSVSELIELMTPKIKKSLECIFLGVYIWNSLVFKQAKLIFLP